MKRPNLSKPVLEQWRMSEQVLKKLVSHLNKKLFDINAWNFWIPGKNKKVKYAEILENIQTRYPDLDWVEAIKSWFKYFPADLQRIKGEANIIFKDHTKKIEEQVNFIEKQDEYITSLEKDLAFCKEKLEKMQNDAQEKRWTEREAMLNKQAQDIEELKEEAKKSIQTITVDYIPVGSISVDVPQEYKVESEPPKPAHKNKRTKRSYG